MFSKLIDKKSAKNWLVNLKNFSVWSYSIQNSSGFEVFKYQGRRLCSFRSDQNQRASPRPLHAMFYSEPSKEGSKGGRKRKEGTQLCAVWRLQLYKMGEWRVDMILSPLSLMLSSSGTQAMVTLEKPHTHGSYESLSFQAGWEKEGFMYFEFNTPALRRWHRR